MAISGEQYYRQLVALMPQGDCWQIESDSNLGKLLRAFADELASIDARAEVLLREMLPSMVNEMLGEYEVQVGLPDACQSLADTTQERRANMARKFTSEGGATRAYFTAVAEALGYQVIIIDTTSWRAGVLFEGVEITQQEWNFVWEVYVADTNAYNSVFKAGQGTAGMALATWQNALLECVLNALKPAHTFIVFSYV